MKPHIQIECDPKVWSQVEALIQSRLPQQDATTSDNQSVTSQQLETAWISQR
jgi:hypothetical protein